MAQKKSILIFSKYFVPGYKSGGPIQSVNSIVNYLKEYFWIFLVTSDRDAGDLKPYNLPLDQWIDFEGINVIYAKKETIRKHNFLKCVFQERKYNVVYYNSFFDVSFTIKPRLYQLLYLKNTHTILSPRGELNKGALTIKKRKKQLFLNFVRYTGFYKNTILHATSTDEKQSIKVLFDNPCFQARNLKFVNRNFLKKLIHKQKKINEIKVVFLSRVSEMKNLLFALKTIKKCWFDVSLDIVGPINSTNADKTYWRRCLDYIKNYLNEGKISYKGVIENSKVYNVLMNYDVFFLPTLGENYGHAILESLIAGTPVVISDKTPFKDLKRKNVGWDIPLFRQNEYLDAFEEVYKMGENEHKKIRLNCKNFATSILEQTKDKLVYFKNFNG